jgi:hypothetical protein
VSFRRRARFADLVRRQLDLFAEDEAELLGELDTAERAYDGANRDNAEEAYGDFQLVLDAGAERLADLRDTYAATLAEDAAAEYEAAFLRAASKRYPRLTGLL